VAGICADVVTRVNVILYAGACLNAPATSPVVLKVLLLVKMFIYHFAFRIQYIQRREIVPYFQSFSNIVKSTVLLKGETVYMSVLVKENNLTFKNDAGFYIGKRIQYNKRRERKKEFYFTPGILNLAAAASAAPSAASAPEASFPGHGAARVGPPAGASAAVAAPLRVRPGLVLDLVRMRLALGHRFGT